MVNKTIEDIKIQLQKDFGIYNPVIKDVLYTSNEDININVLTAALPSIYYRAEFAYEGYDNNIYLIFALVKQPVKEESTYSYSRDSVRVINFSQNPKIVSGEPTFQAELKVNDIDESFEVLYRQFNRNLQNQKFENIFSDKDMNDAQTSFYKLENILNKTKSLRANIPQQVDIANELQTFEINPHIYNDFNLLDLQKACTLFLEARYINFLNQEIDSDEYQILKSIRWDQLYNTYTTKNVSLTYLNSAKSEEFFTLFMSRAEKFNDETKKFDPDSLLIAIYFTIIKDLNTLEEDLFKDIFIKLNLDFNKFEKNITSHIDTLKEEQILEKNARLRQKNRAFRETKFEFKYKSITNPNFNKTRDAFIYMEVLLKELALRNQYDGYVTLSPNRERNFNMYLRTKFAYFKREGLIESSKNGPRYILTSKGRNFLAT